MYFFVSSYLEELGRAGEAGAEYLAMYKRLISTGHWKYYLALKGVLPRVASLISAEIEELSSLEEMTLSSDLSQGYALKALTGVYRALLFHPSYFQAYNVFFMIKYIYMLQLSYL